MKRLIAAMVGVLGILPGPALVPAQTIYRCVDATGNVSLGSGATPRGARCSQLAVPATRSAEPAAEAPATSQASFEDQSKACDQYYRDRAQSASANGSSSLEATCEENTKERYRRDAGTQPAETPESK